MVGFENGGLVPVGADHGVVGPRLGAGASGTVAPMNLSLDRWTTVAHRVQDAGRWDWVEGVAVKLLHRAVENDDVILMHRHHVGGIDLVARLAGPNWRRLRRAISERRGRWA
jgi:hypothetical protein